MDLLKFFGFKRHQICQFVLPTHFIKKVEYVYLTVYRNSVEFATIFNFFFFLGLDLFVNLIEEHKVKSFFEMLRIARYIQDTMKEFIISCNRDDSVIELSEFLYLQDLMRKRDFDAKHTKKFFEFIRENRNELFGNKIILLRDDLDKGIMEFDKAERKNVGRTIQKIRE
jgi:hypothetical protein